MKKIVFISGNICSGKGYFCRNVLIDFEVVKVSTIVKYLTNSNKRSMLTNTKQLDNEIADEIIRQIDDSKNTHIVVDGIRQLSILQRLEDHYKDNDKWVIWLSVSDSEAEKRFNARHHTKDDMTYSEAREADNKLGLGEVEQYIRKNHTVITA